MTLISSIISDAFRESNTIPLGRTPNDAQTTEALRLYNQILNAIYGSDAGEQMTDWPLGNYGRESPGWQIPLTPQQIAHPPLNKRLIALNEQAQTVYLNLRPQDGSRLGIIDPFGRLADFPVTLDANGRTIEGALTLTLDQPNTAREWVYRADLGAWTKLTPVAAEDENPFPAEFDMMFIITLGMRMNPRYGRTIDPQTVNFLKQQRRDFVARYLQSQPLEIDDSISWPFMSRQSYDTQRVFSSTENFNAGYYRR